MSDDDDDDDDDKTSTMRMFWEYNPDAKHNLRTNKISTSVISQIRKIFYKIQIETKHTKEIPRPLITVRNFPALNVRVPAPGIYSVSKTGP